MKVSAPTLIREAVRLYLDSKLDSKVNIAKQTDEFGDGIEAALSALRKELSHTKYASGKTLGEVAAEKVKERLKREEKI